MYSYNPAEEFFDSFFSSGDAAFVGIFLTVFLIFMAIALVMSLIVYVFSAFPLYKLAKKMNRPYAWLAWIPIVGAYCRTYVLCDIAGDKELVIIPDKIVIKSRKNSFWIYVGIGVLGGAIVGIATSILSLIPIIGVFLSVLVALVPAVCLGFMDYAYLRDVLDIFKEDKQSNNTTSIIVTLLDCLVTYGIARIVILFTLLKREPIAENVINCEAAQVFTAPAYAEPTYATPATEAPVVETPVVETTPTNTDNNIQ